MAVGVTSAARADTLVNEKTVAGYRIRMLSDEDRAPHAFRLEIWRDGRLVLARNAGPEEHLELPDWAPPDGADLTGRGQPDLVVEEDTGGQCCRTALIYELGPTTPMLVAKIDAQENERIDFEHRPDLGWVARLDDWTFMLWNTGSPQSPGVPISLAYRGGGLHVVPELMRTPPWSPKLIDRAVDVVRSDFAHCARGDHCLPSPLWAVMLSLTYSGHLGQAQAFLERAWPMQPGKIWKDDLDQAPYAASEAGRQKFWYQFMAQVANSPYWADLHAMNKLPALPGTLDRMPDMPALWLGLAKTPER